MKRFRLAASAFCCTLLASHAALAFCRATTCDPNNPADMCQFGDDTCLITGIPLAWRSSCVTVGVHALGSPQNGFTFDDIAGVVEQAFAAWMSADCQGRRPSIDVQLLGSLECGVSEYNRDAANANIVLVREDDWPHVGAGNAIALTTTRFDKKTGDLWDGDIELNGASATLSIGDPIQGDDLLSVLTHEAGHFLGLSHSPDPEATMKALYSASSDGTSFRSLEPDDVAGICEIYPPERKPATSSCENRHGFSEQCGADQPPRSESEGCSLTCATPSGRVGWPGHALSSLLLVWLLARTKRGGRVQPLVR